MNILSNLTLEVSNQPFLLEKRIDLLFAIQKEGSINKAAKAVPMSYKAAWDAINDMNNLSHTPIVSKEIGGKGGGGTVLTSYGQNLLETYKVLKHEQQKFLKSLEKITDINTGTLNTIQRFAMQISARNQLNGTIQQIDKGTVNSIVYLKLKSGNTIVSNITNGAVESLNLNTTDDVTAIFKSSTVLLTTDTKIGISARNKFSGKIDAIHLGGVNAEVIINLGNNDKLVSIITIASLEDLGLQKGMDIVAIIKSSDVMIGK